MEVSSDDRRDFGKLEYGCEHYRRRCKIRAPCCDKIFPCRHCHNEATSTLEDPKEQHEIVRTEVKQVLSIVLNEDRLMIIVFKERAEDDLDSILRVICSVCGAEQQVAHICSSCGVYLGEYFCEVCKFYDDDIKRGQFHCNGCGICRVGGRENFFHCQKCGSCYPVGLRDNHNCIENSMRNECPVCYEYLFDSLKTASIMTCGHTMHTNCLEEMKRHSKYTCPLCFKSVFDMSGIWRMMDAEVEATVMPEDYRDTKVWILCNDCSTTSEVPFHTSRLKCSHCGSYNTRSAAAPVSPQ